MTLPEINALASCLPDVTISRAVHAGPAGDLSDVGVFRESLLTALHMPTGRVIVNYHMATLGQGPTLGGHFAPVSCYHKDQDAFLILDPWPDTEPTWASTIALWEATVTIDTETATTRGVLFLTCAATRTP